MEGRSSPCACRHGRMKAQVPKTQQRLVDRHARASRRLPARARSCSATIRVRRIGPASLHSSKPVIAPRRSANLLHRCAHQAGQSLACLASRRTHALGVGGRALHQQTRGVTQRIAHTPERQLIVHLPHSFELSRAITFFRIAVSLGALGSVSSRKVARA
jgi:hypothetical protein